MGLSYDELIKAGFTPDIAEGFEGANIPIIEVTEWVNSRFSISEAKQWIKLNCNSTLALKWLSFRADLNEVKEWHKAKITGGMNSCLEWREYDFDVEEAKRWQNAGWSSSEAGYAVIWREEKLFSPDEARQWDKERINPQYATKWKKQNISLEEVSKWPREFSPKDVAKCNEKKISPEEAKQWGRYFSLKDTLRWREKKFSPEEAHQWKGRYFSLQDALRWREKEFSPEEARQWGKEIKFPPEYAVKWREKKFSPVNARRWHNKRIPLEEAVKWKEKISSNPEFCVKWRSNGFTPKTAGECLELSINDPIEGKRIGKKVPLNILKRWVFQGWKAQRAIEWYQAGWSSETSKEAIRTALEWKVKHKKITPEKALENYREGVSPEGEYEESSNMPEWASYDNGVLEIKGGCIKMGRLSRKIMIQLPRTCLDNIRKIKVIDSVYTIGAYVFKDMKKLQEFDGKDDLCSIEIYAFSGCTSLKKVSLKDQTIISLDREMFKGCNLEEVSFPTANTIQLLSHNPFANSEIKNLILKKGVMFATRGSNKKKTPEEFFKEKEMDIKPIYK